MRRSYAYGGLLLVLTFTWSTLFFFRDQLGELLQQYLVLFPWYILICFGCYCLGKLGLDLLLFKDFPNETKKIEAVRSTLFV